jgi:hypothetical protein
MNLLTRIINSLRRAPEGEFVGRCKTRDVAFQFRMGAGFPGDVNRTHPASILPCLADPTNPPLLFGEPVVTVAASNGVRALLSSDTALTAIYGITVRPYPSQSSATAFGTGGPDSYYGFPIGAVDVLRSGFIMGTLGGSVAATKGLPVNVWIAASTGTHVQGTFEASVTAGSTIPVANAFFNGPADANGVVEIDFNS